MYCLSPPLEEVPRGDWFCPNCIAAANDAEDIGFNSGNSFTIDAFQEACHQFNVDFFGDEEAGEAGVAAASIADIEEAFWKMVEEGTAGKSVDVHYGADVDTSVYGSGFPRTWDEDHGDGKRDDEKNTAAEHPWNLNNLPRLSGEHCSLLRQVQDHIPGVLVPWLYVGSTFSSFCWHFEDHMLYSINYNHFGAAKTWYGVPGSGADAFEQCFKQAMPDLFAAQPDLLLQLVTMLSPALLVNDGVPVYRTDQRAGEFVVTFPKSYHAGFNTGFNCAEAVNFAPPDWLRFGLDGVERYRFYRKPSVLCHDELLCVAAADDPSEEVARWLLNDLKRMTAEEHNAREQLVAEGVVRSSRYVPKKLAAAAASAKSAKEAAESAAALSTGIGGDAESAAVATKLAVEAALDPLDVAESLLPTANANGVYDRECTICRYILHLSGVACTCNPNRPACLRHSAELCDCPNSQRVMFYRKSIAQLERLVSSTERACGKRAKASEKEKAFGAARARQKRAAAWCKKSKEALAQKSPPASTASLENLLVGAEEFTWAGEDMDEVRRVAAKVSIAIAFQRELAVLKRRINTGDDVESGVNAGEGSRGGWAEVVPDAVDMVMAAAAGAPVRGRRGGKYGGGASADVEAAEKTASEADAAAASKDSEGAGTKEENEDATTESGRQTNGANGKKEANTGVAPPRRMTLNRLRELLTAAPFPLPRADVESFNKALAAGEDLEHRVVTALAERPNPNPKRCLSLVAEVGRGPIEVTSARRLKDAVAAAHSWSDKLRRALPGRRHRAPRAELPLAAELVELRAAAEGLPVQPNDLSSLDAAMEDTRAWAARAQSLMAMNPVSKLEEAEVLLEEGLDLPTRCPEVDALEEAVDKAKAWAEEANKADEANKSLETLVELLEAGEAMTVGVEEITMLRERIRVRRWADAARLVAVGKPEPISLEEVRDAVAAGAAIIEGSGEASQKAKKGAKAELPVDEDHVTDSERGLLERLRVNVANGEAWEKRALVLISEAESGTLRPLEDAEKLVKEAQAIPVSLSAFPDLSDAATAARAWVEKAQQCLKGKQLTRRGTAAPPPTLAHAERLIRDAGKFIVSVRELAALKERVASAKVWGEQADEATERWRDEGAEQTFNELLLDHERFGLELPAAADVRTCLNALKWEREARAVLKRSSPTEKAAAPPLPLAVLEDLRERARDIHMDDLEEGLEEEVNRRLEAVEAWSARVDAALSGGGALDAARAKARSTGKAAAVAVAAAEQRPTPDEMRELIDEGRKLPAVVPRVVELEMILEEHKRWVSSARALLGPPRPKPTPEELAAKAAHEAAKAAEAAAGGAPIGAEAEAHARAKDKKKKKKKGKGSKSAAVAQATLNDAAAEEARAREMLRTAAAAERVAAAVADRLAARDAGAEGVDARPSMEDVKQMQLTGETLPLKSEEGIELAAAAAAAGAWVERLRKVLIRPRSSAGIHAANVDDPSVALTIIAHSIRAAVADLEGTGEPPESEEGQFCLCRQPGGREMLGCDDCGDWYHLRCVGVTASFARNAKHYTCQACQAAKGDVFKLNKPEVVYKQIHRTRRPSLTVLGEMLLEAMDFSGKLPEEDQLVEVFREYAAWRAAVGEAMKRRASIEGMEATVAKAKAKAEGAASAARAVREAREAREKSVRDRAAAVQQAQVSAGATAMAAALLGAGGGGTATAALEAAQRCAHLPPEQQLEALGQQVAAAAAMKQQQLIQLKGAVAAAAAAGLAGGDGGADSVAVAAESASPFEAMLVSHLQELGTFVHQLATCQQQMMHHEQQQQKALPGSQEAAAQQYQVLIQVMMMQQHFLTLSKQQDMQLDALGGGLLEKQRAAAAEAAAAVEAQSEDEEEEEDAAVPGDEEKVDGTNERERERGTEGGRGEPEQPPPARNDANSEGVKEEAETPPAGEAAKLEPVDGEVAEADPTPEAAGDVPTGEEHGGNADAEAPSGGAKKEGEEEKPKPNAAAEAPSTAEKASAAPQVPRRKKEKPLEGPSEEEKSLEAAAAVAAEAAEKAAAALAAASTPNPSRQIFAGLKGALAMEIEHAPTDPELPSLLREVCGEAWRARARAALGNRTADLGKDAAGDIVRFPTLATLAELRETGIASGVIMPGVTTPAAEGPGPDPLGDEVAALETRGQAWLDRAADAVDGTKEVPVEDVQKLMEEGRELPINLKDELEELGERCEVYCLCKSAYDAARPMISCDACEGWFHYECCGMRPPSDEESEDAEAHFVCPPCCAAKGKAYTPFRPPPAEQPGEGGERREGDEGARE